MGAKAGRNSYRAPEVAKEDNFGTDLSVSSFVSIPRIPVCVSYPEEKQNQTKKGLDSFKEWTETEKSL